MSIIFGGQKRYEVEWRGASGNWRHESLASVSLVSLDQRAVGTDRLANPGHRPHEQE